MDLANIFYALGIVYMTLGIVILVAILIGILYIKNRIDKIYKLATTRIDQVTNAGEAAFDLGTTLVKNIFGKKKKSS